MADRLVIDIEDFATPYILGIMEEMPVWRRQALKSLGWFLQKEIKKGIRSGRPGGKAYLKKRMPPKKRSLLEGRKKGSRYPWLGKLQNAVGYQYLNDENAVIVGWLSKSAIRLGSQHEFGAKKVVTAKMRRKFLAAGLPAPQGGVIETPKRPTIEPMTDYIRPKVAPYLEEKIAYYLKHGGPVSTRKKRTKYTVKGAW